MDIYAQNIIDHYKQPQNYGQLKNPTVSQREANHACGDILELDLEITENKITDLKFRGEGCAISQASMSILSEELIDCPTEKARAIPPQNIYNMLGIEISTRRSKCALLSLLTLKNALNKLMNKPPTKWRELMD